MLTLHRKSGQRKYIGGNALNFEETQSFSDMFSPIKEAETTPPA